MCTDHEGWRVFMIRSMDHVVHDSVPLHPIVDWISGCVDIAQFAAEPVADEFRYIPTVHGLERIPVLCSVQIG